jgi:hypothetical protein
MNRSGLLTLTLLLAGAMLIAAGATAAAQSGTETPVPPVPFTTETAVPPASTTTGTASSATSAASATTAVAASGATETPGAWTPTGQATASSSGGASRKLDIDALLPPGPGRELVLQYCVNCHNIAPIILARKTHDEWEYHRKDHTGRLAITQEEWDTIYNYLETYLTPDRPIPELPPELLNDWTSY